MKEYHTDIHVRIPSSVDQKIESFRATRGKRSTSAAVKELLEIGLFTFQNWSQIKKDPNKIDQIYEQLKEGELVDTIQNIGQREFEILFDIFKNEHKARYGSNISNNINNDPLEDGGSSSSR